MRLFTTLGAVLMGLLILGTVDVAAKKPAHAGGPATATISLDQAEPVVGSATFTVTQVNYKNPYLLWVAVKCSGAGVFTAEYLAVQWNADASMGTAGPFDVTGTEDGPVTSCTAYVWQFPSSETPEGHGQDQVLITFAVGP